MAFLSSGLKNILSMNDDNDDDIHGYDISLFKDKNEANKYFCTICQHICKEPMDIGCDNQHIYCQGCLNLYFKHLRNNDNNNNNDIIYCCPQCKQNVSPNKQTKFLFVKRLIQELQVYCPLPDLEMENEIPDNIIAKSLHIRNKSSTIQELSLTHDNDDDNDVDNDIISINNSHEYNETSNNLTPLHTISHINLSQEIIVETNSVVLGTPSHNHDIPITFEEKQSNSFPYIPTQKKMKYISPHNSSNNLNINNNNNNNSNSNKAYAEHKRPSLSISESSMMLDDHCVKLENKDDDRKTNKCNWEGTLSQLPHHIQHQCQFKLVECKFCKNYLSQRRHMTNHENSCPHQEKLCDLNCGAKVKLKDMVTHKQTECTEFVINCVNDGCTQEMKRKHFQKHQESCLHRQICCDYCKKQMKRKDYPKHVKECPMCIIPCELGCNIQGLKRKDLHKHFMTECSEYVITCINPGCKVKTKRKLMKEHRLSECEYIKIQCKYCKKNDILRLNMKRHENECDMFPVLCAKKCGEKIPKKYINHHYRNECLLTEIKCTNIGCNKVMLRRELLNHINNDCNFSKIDCVYCSNYVDVRHKMPFHHKRCGMYPLRCKLGCGATVYRKDYDKHNKFDCDELELTCTNNDCNIRIKKRHFNKHVLHECPERRIECTMKGCREMIKFKDLSKHIESNRTRHFELQIMYEFEFLKKTLNEKDAKINALTNECTQLKHELKMRDKYMLNKWMIVFENDNKGDSFIECLDVDTGKHETLNRLNSQHIWKWNGDASYCITNLIKRQDIVGYNFSFRKSNMDNNVGSGNSIDCIEDESRCVYRVGGCKSNVIPNVGYKLDTKQVWKLPQLRTPRWGHKVIYSKYSGLIVLGGTKLGVTPTNQTCLKSVEQLKPYKCKPESKYGYKRKISIAKRKVKRGSINNNNNNSDLDDDGYNTEFNNIEILQENSVSDSSNDDDDELKIDININEFKDYKWNYLPPMNIRRHNPSISLIDSNSQYSEKLVVCGGWNVSDLKSCELYNFNNIPKWRSLNNMNYVHQSAGMCEYNNQGLCIVGGWSHESKNTAEIYNKAKDKWILLPNTIYNHRFNPCVSIKYNNNSNNNNDNNIIIVIGDYGCTNKFVDWGYAEFYDLRDKKWYSIESIKNLLHFDTQTAFKYASHTILPPIF